MQSPHSTTAGRGLGAGVHVRVGRGVKVGASVKVSVGKINQLAAFRATALDISNYQFLSAYSLGQGELRVDSKGKFYVMPQGTGWRKIFDIFDGLVKWWREGWNADGTLQGRLQMTRAGSLNGLRVKVARLAEQLLGCFGRNIA